MLSLCYQLAAEQASGQDLAGRQALLIPDLIAFKLTGGRRTEASNASTTGLLDAVTGQWVPEILVALGLRAELFPPLIQPGETVGTLTPAVAQSTGLPATTPVVAVGSHDTASAVVAVPASIPGFAYISSGTWSLVGVELEHPVLSEASRLANFTNERGIDVDSEKFIAPGNMPERVCAAVHATGGVLGSRPSGVVRCILDSLAGAYARTIGAARNCGCHVPRRPV